MGEGPILMVHIGRKIACLSWGYFAGDLVVDLDGVQQVVQERSVGSVLTLDPASLRVVDEWVARHRGPQWLPIEVHRENGKIAKEKRKERNFLRRVAIEEWCRDAERDLKSCYGTISGKQGVYGRSPYFCGKTKCSYDKDTGECFSDEFQACSSCDCGNRTSQTRG